MNPHLEKFLSFDGASICELVRKTNHPRLGIFVPDGSRRLVLAMTDIEPETDEFLCASATLPASYLLTALRIIFSYGLPILLVPVLSSSVLRRGSKYRQLTALTGLQILFRSSPWQDFYAEYDIRVNVYGSPGILAGTECEPALNWIDDTCAATANNTSHSLYFAIGESPCLGDDIAEPAIDFFKQYGRAPTRGEQICMIYGSELPPADFFIMTSKMSGMGALPRFLVNGDTSVYFLPAAGAVGLNDYTFRTILFDLLHNRGTLSGGYVEGDWTAMDRKTLRDYYLRSAQTVIGAGEQIDNIWVPKW